MEEIIDSDERIEAKERNIIENEDFLKLNQPEVVKNGFNEKEFD